MSYEKLLSELESGEIVVIDGATGTELQRRGAKMHRGSWCALATQSNPETLRGIHEDYIRAGARIVTANTFATTREVLEPVGLASEFENLNRRAVEIAVQARDGVATERPVLVAGSISHTRPAISKSSPQVSDLERFEADCTEMAAIHKSAGCDMILAEMMGDAHYTPCVIRAAQANRLPVWVGISARRRTDGVLGTYTDEAVPLGDVLPVIAAHEVDVMGIMHTKADALLPALEMLKRHWSGRLLAYPDFVDERKAQEADEIPLDEVVPDDVFVDYCMRWVDAGVQVLGCCCGYTVSHIAALTERLAAR